MNEGEFKRHAVWAFDIDITEEKITDFQTEVVSIDRIDEARKEFPVKFHSNGEQEPIDAIVKHPDFSKPRWTPEACVDNSLTFTIDDLGNGEYRAPPKGNKIFYSGNLQSFSLFYETQAFFKEHVKTIDPFTLQCLLFVHAIEFADMLVIVYVFNLLKAFARD